MKTFSILLMVAAFLVLIAVGMIGYDVVAQVEDTPTPRCTATAYPGPATRNPYPAPTSTPIRDRSYIPLVVESC